MSTVIVGEIATAQFALHETFDALPDLTVEAERAVDHGQTAVMPLVWTRGEQARRTQRALARDSSVESASLLAEVDGKQLFRVGWQPPVCETLDSLLNAEATLLNATADARSWRFQVLYPSRTDAGMGNGHASALSINRVGQLEAQSAVRYGLTDKQHEALREGWMHGYFDVPRAIGIKELSSNLGITHQAASERLRRGQSSLIKEAFGLHGRGERSSTIRP